MPSNDPKQRLQDIIDNIDDIARSVGTLSKQDFLADKDKYDAAERRLLRISEAAVKLGTIAGQLAPTQPWHNIRGLGNWLRHSYPDIDKDSVWETITDNLPSLRADCVAAIASLDQAQAARLAQPPHQDPPAGSHDSS